MHRKTTGKMNKKMNNSSQLRVLRLWVILYCLLCALTCFPNFNDGHSSTEESLLRANPQPILTKGHAPCRMLEIG